MSILLRPLIVLVAIVVVVVLVVVLALGGFGGGDDDSSSKKAAKPASGTIAARDLKVGDCIADANSTTGDVTTFDGVACDKRHDGEVFSIIAIEGETYPGVKFVTGKGQRGCRARLRRQATPKAFRDRLLGYKFVYPTQPSWAQGDHEVTCLATFRKPRTAKLEQRPGAAS